MCGQYFGGGNSCILLVQKRVVRYEARSFLSCILDRLVLKCILAPRQILCGAARVNLVSRAARLGLIIDLTFQGAGLVLFVVAKMATLPDLDEALIGVAAEKLDRRCSRDDLDEISKSLTRWPEVSPYLGLTEADEEDVRAKSDRAVSGLTRERVNVLRRWRKNQKESATYRWVEFEPHVPLKFIQI